MRSNRRPRWLPVQLVVMGRRCRCAAASVALPGGFNTELNGVDATTLL